MDEDDFFGGLYENGRWMWDERAKRIEFLSNLRPKLDDMDIYTFTAPSGLIEFREDVDLIEQMRYRRQFQRKLAPGQANIITLQDVKDLVLYTAPVNYLSIKIINMLHTATADRFLRALILYCAYSIQVTDTMIYRNQELETKVRTAEGEKVEEEYRDNLSDIRILVAKEYCTILTGAGDMKVFHHMGPLKKQRSFLQKDARSFETFIRMCVQIVYLSLGRRYFHEIEVETHRLLKSETFNAVYHKSQAIRAQSEDDEKRPDHIDSVLLGKCLRRDRQLNTHSPLMNEVFCSRQVDYRLMGLGVVKYPDLTLRLNYLRVAVAAPEECMPEMNINIGIIGLPRASFDTMLRLLPTTSSDAKSKSIVSLERSRQSVMICMKKSLRYYPEIFIPPKESVETVAPIGFTEEPDEVIEVNHKQRRLWLTRFKNMMRLLCQRRR